MWRLSLLLEARRRAIQMETRTAGKPETQCPKDIGQSHGESGDKDKLLKLKAAKRQR